MPKSLIYLRGDILVELGAVLILAFMLGFCVCHYLMVRKPQVPEIPCTCLKPTCVCRGEEIPW